MESRHMTRWEKEKAKVKENRVLINGFQLSVVLAIDIILHKTGNSTDIGQWLQKSKAQIIYHYFGSPVIAF